MRYIKLIIVLLIFPLALSAQEYKLAQQYFSNGEYEKASIIYEKLQSQNPNQDYYFDRYIECLLLLENYKEYEKQIKKRIKAKPKNVQLYVKYGGLYERLYEPKKAEEEYRKAIDQLPPNRVKIIQLSNAFIKLAKYDMALEAYEKGGKLLKNKNTFAYEMADLYRRKGDRIPMIENYLSSLEETPQRLTNLKTIFQRFFTEEDYKELQTQLYARIQEDPKKIIFPELLAWVFIQKKDYKNALRQVRAIDMRMEENGGRVYRLAQIASRAKDYDAAIAAYEYIIEKKGKSSTYYLEAQRETLNAKQKKLVSGYAYTQEDLTTLESEYETFLNEYGRNHTTAHIIYELAELEAFYINDLDKAIQLLEDLLSYPNLRRHIEAKSKITLGDFYLMSGDIWESTLLYSQVDKAFKDDVIGQRARFKNAKLSYYNGDFEWAQAQFSILKASTSKLIANDALDLSIFILDNLALDTVLTPMQMYARADLLAFQNRFDRSFEVLDSIKLLFPNHALQDDIYFTKAEVYLKKLKLDDAVKMLEAIIKEHPESIRTDNALFMLGDLYENHLKDEEKAKTYYETIIYDYSNSTFAVESRKRFRVLRGDIQ